MNPKVCVDASIVLRWMLPNPQEQLVEPVLTSWTNREMDLIAPPVLDIEISSVLIKLIDRKKISSKQGEAFFSLYQSMEISIISPKEIGALVWRMIPEYDGVSFIDLQYLATAELADCEFWTGKRKLFHHLKDRNQRVRFIGEPTAETQAEPRKTVKTDFPGLWRAI